MRYSQIKQALKEAEIIDEVKMSPSALQKFADSPEAEGMLMGIEFEMCVPNVAVDDDSGEGEYDYDMDERAYDIDGVVDFFQNGENSTLSSRGAQRLREEMWDQYLDWTSEKIADNLDTDELNDRVRDRLSEDIDWEDYVDDAREELGDEVSDDAVEERAKELAEEALDNEMSDASSRNYERAYDDIRQEMEDDMRNDGDYDQQAWLNDIGIDFMSEAEREWSLDWPHWRYYGGGGELDVETVADEFGRAMGLEYVNSSNSYHGARRDGKNWIVEPDSSIDADEGDGGLEFVSPPLPIKEGLEMLQKMYKWAKDNGCYTNNSTGLHMNISVPDMTIEKLDYVKLALFMGDEYILKQFGRQYNSYAKSAMSKIRDRIRPEEVPTVLNTMKQHLNSLASKTIHSGITDKYTSINTKDNYVEFRGPGGDYLDMNPFEVANTVLRLAMSLRIATNPEAYKQEYAKKLYKLVEQDGGDWTDPNNSVALFSRYALGEINKSELVDNVRQAQIARKEKKGEEQQYWVMNKDGSGGKQLVFATSQTEAIIKGGKQMGMNREKSISTLKAEVKTAPIDLEGMSKEEYYKQTNALPTYNLEQFVRDIKTIELSSLEHALDNVKNRKFTSDMTPANYEFLQAVIEREIANRSQPVDDADMTQWRVYITRGEHAGTSTIINAVTPRQAKVAAQSILRSQVGSFVEYDDLEAREETSGPQTTPTTSREVFDSLPETWQTWLQRIGSEDEETLSRAIDNVVHGSNAAVRDLSDEQRVFIKNTCEQELRRRNSSGDALNSLSQAWQSWLGQVNVHANETLENMLRTIEAGTGDVERMTPEQRNLITTTIHQELRSRQQPAQDTAMIRSMPLGWQQILSNVAIVTDENLQRYIGYMPNISQDLLSPEQKEYISGVLNNELQRRNRNNMLAANAGRETTTSGMTADGREMFDSLSQGWQDILTGVSELPGETLQSYVDHILTIPDNVISAEQKDFMIQVLNTEMRRRRNNDDLAANAARAENEVRASLPQSHREFLDDLANKSDIGLINILRNNNVYQGVSEQAAAYFRIQLKHELRRRGINPGSEEEANLINTQAADQQADLINRDDPVTSNDPEAESPIAPQWYRVGNHTYGRELLKATSQQDAVNQFADRNNLTQAQVTDEPGFVAEPTDASELDESIDLIRRLAGLK